MLKKRRRKRKRKKDKQKQSHKNYKENTGTKLITITKKHKLKIQSIVWNFKNTMLKKRRKKKFKKIINIYIYMKFALKKNRVFFFFAK